jgi:hypothetical protein
LQHLSALIKAILPARHPLPHTIHIFLSSVFGVEKEKTVINFFAFLSKAVRLF